jgi:hypothetical protein
MSIEKKEVIRVLHDEPEFAGKFNDDPSVNVGREGKNSIRLYFFEFQDCIDRGFLTQDSRLQVTNLSQTLVSLHL